ncbi:MAG: hypothetical protein CMI36_05415 [Owenweeksia sp.]|nr:hypothetical protein [Owenweeksia sp.]
MQNNTNIRLAFEAYAQFSGKLMACVNIEDMQGLLVSHLKYLFNYKKVRIAYVKEDVVVLHQVGKDQILVGRGEENILNEFEQNLRSEGIPLALTLENEEKLHAWRFGSMGQGLVLFSVLTEKDEEFLFNHSIMKLLAESLLAKFLQFSLYEALDSNNEKLNQALITVQHQNDEIRALARSQKIELAEKTRDIRAKNEELQNIVKLNAHEVREPLSRIMGLIGLLKHTNSHNGIAELPLIEEAALELDAALKHVILRAETKLKSNLS